MKAQGQARARSVWTDVSISDQPKTLSFVFSLGEKGPLAPFFVSKISSLFCQFNRLYEVTLNLRCFYFFIL